MIWKWRKTRSLLLVVETQRKDKELMSKLNFFCRDYSLAPMRQFCLQPPELLASNYCWQWKFFVFNITIAGPKPENRLFPFLTNAKMLSAYKSARRSKLDLPWWGHCTKAYIHQDIGVGFNVLISHSTLWFGGIF